VQQEWHAVRDHREEEVVRAWLAEHEIEAVPRAKRP
jgi:hypothetical protein